jgi:hypothetical protein
MLIPARQSDDRFGSKTLIGHAGWSDGAVSSVRVLRRELRGAGAFLEPRAAPTLSWLSSRAGSPFPKPTDRGRAVPPDGKPVRREPRPTARASVPGCASAALYPRGVVRLRSRRPPSTPPSDDDVRPRDARPLRPPDAADARCSGPTLRIPREATGRETWRNTDGGAQEGSFPACQKP